MIESEVAKHDLDLVVRLAPPHLRPIYAAVRDCQCGMLTVIQSDDRFQIPNDGMPCILIIGDDLDWAKGPSGFHLPSLRRAIRACQQFFIVSCEPITGIYLAAASVAVALRENVMLIETRIGQETAWDNLIRDVTRGAKPVVLATLQPSGGVN